MANQSSHYESLSRGVQRWIYQSRWQSLRAVQEVAIPLVLGRESDVLITAPTAGGKTEAAFLPIISHLESNSQLEGYSVICFSPLKALINDQVSRLEDITECAGTQITPWHGDIAQSRKNKSWESPEGILLITPESIEAMFVNRGEAFLSRIAQLRYIVIDEFHAFIGSERGMQLISQLARIEAVLGRKIPRIALSATIGDVNMAFDFLRPSKSFPREHVDANAGGSRLLLSLAAFVDDGEGEDEDTNIKEQMARYLHPELIGDTNLVFANSRRCVEEMTYWLSMVCEEQGRPNEFFAHHGSLSRELRHQVEAMLKDGSRPTTGVGTSTLELGIDIGDVSSVAQVEKPSATSELCQRLGRSGRRGDAPSILRVVVEANTEESDSPLDHMEVDVLQSIAAIELLLEKWIEPKDIDALHQSTFIQQVLSCIAFAGGSKADFLYLTLCREGPFQSIDLEKFKSLLRDMGNADIIQQLPGGEFVCGLAGERMISHYTFYSAFETPEEMRVIHDSNTLGSLSSDKVSPEGSFILFGGRCWLVESIDVPGLSVYVRPAKNGQAPKFGGGGALVHRGIRQKQKAVLCAASEYSYLTRSGPHALARARRVYRTMTSLGDSSYIQFHGQTYWFIWEGDKLIEAISIALTTATEGSLNVLHMGPCIAYQSPQSPRQLIPSLMKVLKSREGFVSGLPPLPLGKFDEGLSDESLKEGYSQDLLDIKGALDFVEKCLV